MRNTSGEKQHFDRGLRGSWSPYRQPSVQTTAAAQWEGVGLIAFELSPVPELTAKVAEPTLDFNTLVIHTATPVRLRRKFEGPTKSALSTPGSLCLHPARTPGAYAWDAACTIAFLMSTPFLLAQVATEVTRNDPDAVALHDDFTFQDGLLKHLSLALLEEARSGGLHGRVYAESLGHALILHLLSHYSTASRFRSLPDKALSRHELRRAQDFIRAHLEQNVPLAKLAASVQLSPSHFIRQFKRATGLAPHQYLTRCRVERAKELLTRGGVSVASVAQQVGFFDQSHLIRHFKRWVGVTPKVYQDSLRR